MDGLRTRPTTETYSLDDLVDYARQGRLRVPSFQRGLRWGRADVILLLDSVVKGYPIGSLLLWERDAPAEAVELGGLRIDAAAGAAFWVVDGQQRVTALVCALTEAAWVDQRFTVGYDLEAEVFTGPPLRPADTWIPAHVLFDLSALLSWFRDHPDVADYFDQAAAISRTLRDLRLPAYVVRQESEAVLRGIFDRMNNAGKKLTRGEVFAALHRSGGAAATSPLRAAADGVQLQTAFGTPEETMMMDVVLARRGADVRREIRNEFESSSKGRDAFAVLESLDEAYRKGEQAAVGAIRFLENVAGVPHQAFLPYQYLLVALARFLAHHSSPSPRHTRLLRRFFWRAVVNGPSLVPGGTTGVSRALNHRIEPTDELASIQGLMSLVSGPAPLYPAINPFRTNTASSKILLCALWRGRPMALTSNRSVGDEELRAALGEQPTALTIVTPILSGRAAEGYEKSAGNRLMVVDDVDQESGIEELLSGANEEALASHGLPPETVSLLANGRGAELIDQRSAWMADLQRTFLDSMCEWEQEDTPDLALLEADGIADGASS